MINARAAMVARLPPEILRMIFEAVCTAQNTAYGFPLWNGRGVISLTCFQWRQVVLSTPELWRQLVVHLRFKYTGSRVEMWPVPDPSIVPIIPLVIQQASPYPLKFQLINRGGTCTMLGYHWHRIMPHIISAIQQSSMVRIGTFYRIQPGPFSGPVPWPKLRYLWLNWGHTDSEGVQEPNSSDEYDEPNSSDEYDELNPSDEYDEPDMPDAPDAPDVPDVPDAPDAPDMPDMPTNLMNECVDLSMATSLCLLSISVPFWLDEGSLRFRLPQISNIKQLVLRGNIDFSDVLAALTCSASQLEWLDLNLSISGGQWSPTTLYLHSLHHLIIGGRASTEIACSIVAPQLHSLVINGGQDLTSMLLVDGERFPCLVDLHIRPIESATQNTLTSFIKVHPSLQRIGLMSVLGARQFLLEDNPEIHNPDLRALWIRCGVGMPASEECAVLRQLAEHLQTASVSLAKPNCSLYLSHVVNWWRGGKPLLNEFKEYVHYVDSWENMVRDECCAELHL